MRRLWPLGLALFCWLLVLLVPATRRGLVAVWSGPSVSRTTETESVVVAPERYLVLSPEIAAVLRCYPRNRDALIYAARRGGPDAHNLEVLGQIYPRDAFVVALRLSEAMQALSSARALGPLSNPRFPAAPTPVDRSRASPPEEWQGVIDLARQGQALQPNNTYFDWMLLYALYGSERDDEAKRVLAGAAKKTGYNGFDRETVLNAIAFRRLTLGSPLPHLALLMAENENSPRNGLKRQVARWAMESALADRKVGQHDRAIDAAFNLAKLSETMQRGGYSYINFLTAFGCESLALQNLDEPIKNGVSNGPPLPPGSPLSLFHSHPRSLYFYAKQQGRSELLPALDAHWARAAKRSPLLIRPVTRMVRPYSMEDVGVLTAGERLRSLIVRALPSVVLVGIVFWLLSRRFREEVSSSVPGGAPSAWMRGMVLGTVLLVLVMGFDVVMVMAAGRTSDWRYAYLESALLERAPSWISYGLAGAMFCFAISAAIAWQKRASGEKRGLKQGLRETFQGAGDGLSGFDFGWLFGWVARLTFWLLFLATLVGLASTREKGFEEFYSAVVPLGVLISLMLHFLAWHRGLRRRQTLLLSFRLVTEAMGGFFAIASVLYALVAFALLPMAWGFDRDFEVAMKQGDLKLVRAKAGF